MQKHTASHYAGRETDRYANKQTHTHTHTETERQRDRQRDSTTLNEIYIK